MNLTDLARIEALAAELYGNDATVVIRAHLGADPAHRYAVFVETIEEKGGNSRTRIRYGSGGWDCLERATAHAVLEMDVKRANRAVAG